MGTRTVEPSVRRSEPAPLHLLGLKLVVVAGPDEGREVAVRTLAEIGTGAECQLQLTDPSVSRRHVSVAVVGAAIAVKDLGSRNGTFLAGARLREAEVPLGAVLQLGDSAVSVQPRLQVKELAPSMARAFGEVLGQSLAMREVFAILERVAPTDVTMLIEGETGTGKELVARSIHAASSRREAPYVVFDCGSVPHELAESELFGHRRGAFSGAVADRTGAFRQADRGTLCLDELGELPLELQPKLLRVLETGEVRSVGSDEVRKVNVRVLACTNRELRAEVRRGRFREDLLYRVEVMRVRIPPLRARPDDIELLVRHLLEGKLASDSSVSGPQLAHLVSGVWPGNVRELRNVLQRAVALAPKDSAGLVRFERLAFTHGLAANGPATIGQDLPGVASPVPFKTAKAQLNEAFERAYVDALMERHKGNVSRAAAAAGLSRQHLHELIRRTSGAPD
jgi:transcriptional regulator with GAF, ATPase, and Fis domain